MVRAAAASSPHIMSLMTRPSLPFSSDRRMGRPTMEGYWNSGKFLGSNAISFWVVLLGIEGEDAYLGGVANFEETGSSVEDCGIG